MDTSKQVAQPPQSPAEFVARFPRYVYRPHKGGEQVQWKLAALDMCEALYALRSLVRMTDRMPTSDPYFNAALQGARSVLAKYPAVQP